MSRFINGIQQVGIGVTHATSVFNWYREHMGFDILVFEDESQATLMKNYTGGNVYDRHALLAMNLQGGGGLEVWQFKDREPKEPEQELKWGDLGINAIKVKSAAIQELHMHLRGLSLAVVTEIDESPELVPHFFFKDPWNNLVEVVADPVKFTETKSNNGGVVGAIIGVADMEKSIRFYQELLEYDTVVYDETRVFQEFQQLPEGQHTFRRVLLKHSKKEVGGFGELLGPSQIELIQVIGRTPYNIYKNRYWGDLGFIHLCFDVLGMEAFGKKATSFGSPFTVDSSDSFDMGKAAGHFAYLEDPDGTLIELVETHKVPIVESLGLFIDLRKRSRYKPLPKWLVRAMRIHRVTKNRRSP